MTLSKEEKVKLVYAKREKKIRIARTNFYEYCKIINPSFFKPNRTHLKILCDTLQSIYEGTLINPKTNKPYKNLSISLPAGFGKSYTTSLFSQWVFGNKLTEQIITVSYNEKMSSKFSRTVRDGIGVESANPLEITYANIFPNTRINQNDSSKHNWSLEGHYMNYLATSPNGSMTGQRASIGIIDDLVKNAYEAFNDRILEEHWEWYTDTYLSRLLEGAIQIVIATRWSTKDLIGKLISKYPDEWYELKLPACLNEETGEMLCDELMSYERYCKLKDLTSEEIFNANWQQQPIEAKGKLYQKLQTYDVDEFELPDFEKIINYTDTADKGNDYLSSIVAGLYKGQLYVLDVLYTQDDMSVTERQTAEMLMYNKVNESTIESNNGGLGFARAVERILTDEFKTRYTSINTFHQSKNKESRILTMSSFVQRNVFFPSDWGKRWNDFYIHINTYQREFRNNKHDDGADALTGLCELIENGHSNEWRAVPSLY